MPDPGPIIHDPRSDIDALEQDRHAEPGEQTATTAITPSEPVTAGLGQTSRRRLLGRAAQAAAAAAVASALVQRESGDAAADHASDIYADTVSAHLVYGETVRAENREGSFALGVITDSEIFAASFYNAGAGSSVHAVTDGIGPAVNGIASKDAANPGYGVLGAAAYGVIGQSLTTDPGFHAIWGLCAPGVGTGVLGEGKVGVHGKATAGEGVASDGYAGVFEGGKAQLRLVPGETAGKPKTGQHQKGELYLDRNANLWLCRAGGTPGTWRKVALG